MNIATTSLGKQLAKDYVLDFRKSFSLTRHYELSRICQKNWPRVDLTTALDSLSELSMSYEYNEVYAMAKKEAKAPAAVEKVAKPVKAAPAAEKGSPAVPRQPKIAETAKLVWLVTENPKRVGSESHARFEGYFKTKTVAAFLEAGGSRADLANDSAKGYLEINE